MTYRISLLATALVATTAAVAAAQNPAPAPATPPPAQGTSMAAPMQAREGGGGLERLLQGITLSAAQRTRVDSIRARHTAEMPAMTPGTPPDSAARASMRMHGEAMQRDIRAVLTPEQQTVWDRNVAAARAAAPPRP